VAVCAAALLAIVPVAASAAPGYLSITPAGGKYTSTVDLNDAGRFAVNNFGPEISVEPAYISNTPLNEDVGSLGGDITRIRAINNKGEAIGVSTTADRTEHCFFYSSGRMQDLSVRYGIGGVGAINDRGDITGYTAEQRGGPHQPAGRHAGRYEPEGQAPRTCIYSDGRCTDLPLFGGKPVLASAINDFGWVSGSGAAGTDRQHAFFYDGKTMADLTPEAANAAAWDLNNLGHVVGSMDSRAFVYPDGRLTDLNTLVDPDADLLLTSVYAIDNREQILAKSGDRTGVFCYGTVLLDTIPAVPEPSNRAMWLLVLDLLGALRGWKLATRL
jgi:probable HAF family extracellular repeat protein